MDPHPYSSYYPPSLPPLPPTMRPFPFPATSSASPSSRGMIFYPQPLPMAENSQQESSAEPEILPGPSGSGQIKRPLDKKLRRQIANCNERRRMQSINAGFHTLRVLMPHLQGEKLSKAAVLQHAAEHIFRLNQERERLLQQNTSLRVMLSKYWPNGDPNSGEESQDAKVNKATSPLCFDDERAASKELEQIFATQKEVDRIKAELERERSRRISLEARLKDRSPSEEDDEYDTESEMEELKHKRPRVMEKNVPPGTTRNNLDIIVRAIRQIEGDAFSRSATPTCGSQERSTGTFTPISTGDNSRVSPVTPVCAS